MRSRLEEVGGRAVRVLRRSPTPPRVSAAGERRRERLRAARLCLVIEAELGDRPTGPIVAAALAGGVDVVQLREKSGDEEAIVRTGRALRSVCQVHGALLVVNDRPDLALACDADGVHVGQDDSAVADVRRLVGEERLIGLSTHSSEEIAAAGRSDADYLGVGPVYATATKPEAAPVGVALVSHAAAHARQPFFAIGGIDGRTAPAVAAAGGRRIAVVRAIRDAADPRAAAAGLRAALEREAAVGAGT